MLNRGREHSHTDPASPVSNDARGWPAGSVVASFALEDSSQPHLAEATGDVEMDDRENADVPILYDSTSNYYVSDYACSDAASLFDSWINVGTPPPTLPPCQPPISSVRKSQDTLSGSKDTIINIISTNSASAS
ncbi:hypothetical protein FRC06_004474 [Ceratobasidium sp. 370]|nr:hypothetical protein FRC06_004474 [Ceratobasidium sp. 370]